MELELVKILWDYMYLGQSLKKCDCILGLGTYDLNIPKRCAELYHEGYGDFIIFTGSRAKSTSNWEKTEAETFKDIAVSLGVPEDKIYVENKATNTGENFLFTKQLIEDNNLKVNSFLVVQKPYMERRCYAAFKANMPLKECVVTSPKITFWEHIKECQKIHGNEEEFINVIVGDVQRIKVYAEKGWQIKQDIPDEVWQAYLKLVNMGYNKYVIKD